MKKGSLLQLSIEPYVRSSESGGNSRRIPRSSNKMSAIDWKRGATEVLLKLYKEHPILYNMRHPKYYNKNERQMALNTIIDLLEDHRPGTSTNDILKKIQTMRTQFGQEYGKVKRAQDKGIQYVPTVWWYNYLSFLRHHIRPRNTRDPEPEQEQEQEDESSYQQGDEEYESYTEMYDEDNDDSEVVYEIQNATPGKDTKSDLLGQTKLMRKSHNVMTTLNGASKEQIIFEITDADTVVPKRKHEILTPDQTAAAATPPPVKILRQEVITSPKAASLITLPEPATPIATIVNTSSVQESVEVSVESDRARSLGNFVASQINGIKDDYLFYSTQMDVLNVINKALLKQLHMEKEEKAAKKAKADE